MTEYQLAIAFWSVVVAISLAAPLLVAGVDGALHALRAALDDLTRAHHGPVSLPSSPRPSAPH